MCILQSIILCALNHCFPIYFFVFLSLLTRSWWVTMKRTLWLKTEPQSLYKPTSIKLVFILSYLYFILLSVLIIITNKSLDFIKSQLGHHNISNESLIELIRKLILTELCICLIIGWMWVQTLINVK